MSKPFFSNVALRYTPTNEHFGIVPIEAMHAGVRCLSQQVTRQLNARLQVPVLATNSGGPTESILHEATGWLLPSDDDAQCGAGSSVYAGGSAAQAWSDVMACAAADEGMCARMGKAGR